MAMEDADGPFLHMPTFSMRRLTIAGARRKTVEGAVVDWPSITWFLFLHSFP